jgi:capsular polysaccharide transport system permease protein
MIKKFLLLHWQDRFNAAESWRVFRKSWARWRRHGYGGMRERLEKEYTLLKEDFVLFHRFNKRYGTFKLRVLFLLLFVLSTGYYLLVKSELYESSAALVVRDLNEKSAAATGLSLLGAGVSSQMQDSKILEEYLQSPDVLAVLDAKFGLDAYYRSDALDVLSRLGKTEPKEELLKIYRDHLHVLYDEVSGILSLSFTHTDSETARRVVAFLIERAEEQLNIYNDRNAEKQLAFVRSQVEKNRAALDASTAALEAYQNEHLMLDPAADAQTQSAIISELESALVQKRTEYNQMKRYMSDSSFDVIKLKNEIKEMQSSLKTARETLSGGDQERLNAVLFEYERLKAQAKFDEEVYKESLVQLEIARVDANKQAKSLVVLTEPNLPEGYSYPDKPQVFVTLLLVFFLGYGIVSLVLAIIKDHKD